MPKGVPNSFLACEKDVHDRTALNRCNTDERSLRESRRALGGRKLA
jgi:hypothetical protein